eukprot:jgi/Ulvmu1/3796/UM018_0006.1
MGQAASVGLTQHDVEGVCAAVDNVFDQKEIETLYWRFRSLDRGRKGFVTEDELLAIPELSINPLAARICRMLDGCNFMSFVKFLAAFSSRASVDAKKRFLFQVYDVDGDGLLSYDDLRSMLSHLVGGQLSDEQVQQLLARAASEAASPGGIDYATFCRHADVATLEVAVPANI